MRNLSWIFAVLAFAVYTPAQGVILEAQNLSSARQRAWVQVGTPTDPSFPLPGHSNQGWPVASMPGGYAVRIDLAGQARGTVTSVAPAIDADLPQGVTGWVLDEAQRLVPRFLCWTKDGVPYWAQSAGPPAIISVQSLGPALRVAWRCRFPVPIDLTIEGWWTLWPDQDSVDISLQAIWGTTATQGMSAELGELSLVIGERPVIDHARRKGLPEPAWLTDFGGVWKQALATPRPWGRGSRVQWSGALLCLPAGEKWASLPGDERHKLLAARLDGPVCAISGSWSSGWGGLSELPERPPGAAVNAAARWSEFKLAPAGDEYQQRQYGQPKEAGTTGEQADFGCMRGELAAVMLEPWSVHDMRYQVQSWGLRPTSNREPDGRPVVAGQHQRLTTYNQRPDSRLGQDLLGWPRDVPYAWPGSGYGTADDQHRTDNLLVACWLTTRDPAVGSVISDLLEMDLARYWPPLGAPIASPRDWGRTELAWSHYAACGFTRAKELLARSLEHVLAGAALNRTPNDVTHTVRVLADNEQKYGWTDGSGQLIRCWLPWQEGIAAIGLWGAWKQLGDSRARDLAVAISETIVRHGFFTDAQGRWWTCYAVRWRTDDPGVPLPLALYQPGEGSNGDVFTYGIERWMLGAVRLAALHSADEQVRSRANALLLAFPVKDWADSCWRAIGP